MRSSRSGGGYALALLAGCAGPADDPGTGPAAFELELPPIALAAGTQPTLCYHTTVAAGAAISIRGWESEVSTAAHGLQIFATPRALQPDGTLTEACAIQGDDRADPPRLLYTAIRPEESAALPAGVALRLGPAQPIVIRVHLANAGDDARTAIVRVRALAAADDDDDLAATYISYRTDVRVDPWSEVTVAGSCAVPAGLHLYRLSVVTLGHATRTEVQDDRGLLFRNTDQLHPGDEDWSDAPRAVTGRLRYECIYRNRSDLALTAGGVEGRDELCMVMAQVTPAAADLRCVDDVLIP